MTEKLTKKEKFAIARNYFESADVNAETLGMNPADLVDFFDHEIELLNNKKSGSRKPTKTQIENEAFKQVIVDTLFDSDKPMTISELNATEKLSELSNQRVNALVTQLKHAQIVDRLVEKGKPYFFLKPQED